ncbi:MAG: M28 family peptidase [Micrococcales bacterium]|nr:M28 family peptidase [Micrococcales bacterium]
MDNQSAALRRHMAVLCDQIGPRPTGSAANRRAVDYVDEELTKVGWSTERQAFECIDWINSGASLRLLGVADLAVEPAEYAMPGDVKGRLVAAGTVEELADLNLAGQVLYLHGDLAKEPLMPKGFEFYNPEEHQQIIGLLEGKAPAAIITAGQVIQDGDFDIPCGVVQPVAHDLMLAHQGLPAHLVVRTERRPAVASNLIGNFGSGPRKVCLSAHIDTKATTPGALDNASGVAVLLVAAAQLANQELPLEVQIVVFNGEDYYSTPGEMVFMRQLKPEFDLAINVDGVGLKGSPTSYSFYQCPDLLAEKATQVAEQVQNTELIEPWPMGDHMVFATCGIPSIALTASGIFPLIDQVLHTPKDTLDLIDFEILSQVVDLVVSLSTS